MAATLVAMAAVGAMAVPKASSPDTDRDPTPPGEAAGGAAAADGLSPGSSLGLADAGADSERQQALDQPVPGLAYADASTHLPATDPAGAPYRTCFTDYRHLDWEAEPETVVATHRQASAGACSAEGWYRRTAFQNAILGFMVLVGEASLAGALPTADDPAAMVDSLRRQGFDRLDSMEISDSGPCERGGVQLAMFELRQQPIELDHLDATKAPAALDGLEALLGGAEAAGATVERTETATVVTGGGAACATAIVHTGRVFGWLTTSDRVRLDGVLSELDLRPSPIPRPTSPPTAAGSSGPGLEYSLGLGDLGHQTIGVRHFGLDDDRGSTGVQGASGCRDRAPGHPTQEVRLRLDGGGARRPLREVEHGAGCSRRIGEGHDGAAVQQLVAGTQLRPPFQEQRDDLGAELADGDPHRLTQRHGLM